MSAESGAGFILWKFGSIKLVGFGAALMGAGLMAIFRAPRTKKEMFFQGMCALAGSFILGGTAVSMLDSWFTFIDLASAPLEDVLQFNITVHGLIGAMSWGIFGGIAELRDRLSKDPTKTIKEIKDDVLS